ncbi:uncharacterized protein PGTG_04949 [Puccinia graminis f. sp. tritici CRL 75-36-700-3]|uniref:Uncharacterized protein n=1 Tax=Puccinia graminis f. sp. tritici (strain CRL 75-36-700-3 / race SCCL) TaxID=418459 RepID=E3K3D6_PUCGT|nr:uncharacterized protein PGTG_04949 [Puccinia graminis f. sp. tritici CRL 75-36-700-3]EFP78993.2 hypothetical protein PGTG_04949 [Puccinia graminis f. sp. tritici CRL 75-36-700-3]
MEGEAPAEGEPGLLDPLKRRAITRKLQFLIYKHRPTNPERKISITKIQWYLILWCVPAVYMYVDRKDDNLIKDAPLKGRPTVIVQQAQPMVTCALIGIQINMFTNQGVSFEAGG